jgi:hypothetical protein
LLAYLSLLQHQLRPTPGPLFPALIPIGIGVVTSLQRWRRELSAYWPVTGYYLPLALAVDLVGLDLMALFHIIVSNLAP